ncbi:MAG TPA: MMPL family transporter [Thermoleophilaceae bacterium]|jgi:hydrophobe/amphiphile efflux-3 (HAE3) family protein
MGERFGGIVRVAARHPVAVLGVVALLALGGAALALRLEPSADTSTLVNRSSDTYQATQQFKKTFGDEAVVVLVKGDLQRTVLTSDLGRLLKLEGCLSGNVPKQGLAQLPKTCTELARFKPAKVVYGPGTFINTAAGQISDEFVKRQNATRQQAAAAAETARKEAARRGASKAAQQRVAKAASDEVNSQFQQQVLQLALRYGLTSVPSIDSADFVSSLVFDTGAGQVGEPKAKFAFLFPSKRAALIQVRLRPNLSDSERKRAIDLIKTATGEDTFKPRNGAQYIVTGVPVVAEGLATAVQHSIFVLLGAALLVMAATLALVFRSRLRLLPLALALAAAAMTFGALSLAGGSLTMASIAVLPVLIGLAVDYAIQFQARFDEERERRPRDDPAEAAASAAAAGGPTIATAGLATAVGFLVLLLSPVPMVRGFGLLLVLGIVLGLGCALTAGFAALVRFAEPRERPADLPPSFPQLRQRFADWGAAVRHSRASEWLADRSWRALHFSIEQPRRVLAIGLALAVIGWAVDTQSTVLSDVRELVPSDLPALRDANQLQDATGVSGEIDVAVHTDDITKPSVVAWMTRFQRGVLKAHGYKTGARCSDAKGAPQLCPALSLPDLFSSAVGAQGTSVRQLLDAVPPYFSQGVVSHDRKTANLAFGIRLMPLDKQKQVVDDIKRRLDPPKGVQAQVVGLPVLAAEANGSLSSPWRRDLTLLAALLGVFLVLLAVRRSRREAAVPLIPIALATGWSGGLLFILGLLPGPLKVELNPMSVTLSALVIAISTEFSVLLSARYRQERDRGAGAARAIQLTYASTGAAVLASGATAIAGFAALIASDIRMLRDFGIVTVADLTISLLGVMVVLPAALLWAEEHGAFKLADLDPRPVARELWDARPSLRLPRLRRRRPRRA